jgi:hypothetical protein
VGMKYIPKLYLETTVFNFYFAEKEGRKKQDTIKLFDNIKQGKYEAFISKFVYDEISKASSLKYWKMQELIEKYIVNILIPNQDSLTLANIYIRNGIIPVKYLTDASHIAIATVNKLNFVVSYNMGHIVKLKTMTGTGFANLHHGYHQIGLCSPTEVMDYGQN